jgi:hypothetical protein
LAADSPAFEVACAALERLSGLSLLEARGTMRLALRDAGMDANTVTAKQLAVVVARVLPRELESRDVRDPARMCDQICAALATVEEAPRTRSALETFERLGSS